jgi:RNA polymerase primary sigma factor
MAPGSSPDRSLELSIDRSLEADDQFRSRTADAARPAISGSEVDGQLRRLADDEAAPAELADLAAAAQRGDMAARSLVVERCLPMVVRIARRYAGRDVELSDLVQEGALGILRALERFDPGRGVPFSAYASWWVRQSMQQAIAEQSRSVRLPTHVLWDIHRLREARAEILADTGREASAAALEQRLDWSGEHLDDVVRVERPSLSFDAAFSGDEGEIDSLGDLVSDPLSEHEFEDVINDVAAHGIRRLLSTLTARERQVLGWRLGLEGEELSLRQIGRRLGMSAERVRQIEHRALVKLRGLTDSQDQG